MDLKKQYTITIDDDPVMHRIIQRITGITSLPFTQPEKLLQRAESFQPMAVFVDIHLHKDICGLNFIPEIRQAWLRVPIIVVTDDSTAKLIGEALALGANDFLRKPLVPEEVNGRLTARMNEMAARQDLETLSIDDVTYDYHHRTLTRGCKTTYLPNLEAKLFETLASSNGMSISKDVIKGRLWGKIAVSENALDKKISSLRKHLKEIDADLGIKSAYGGGVNLYQISEQHKAQAS